jgi:hypothetical protein
MSSKDKVDSSKPVEDEVMDFDEETPVEPSSEESAVDAPPEALSPMREDKASNKKGKKGGKKQDSKKDRPALFPSNKKDEKASDPPAPPAADAKDTDAKEDGKQSEKDDDSKAEAAAAIKKAEAAAAAKKAADEAKKAYEVAMAAAKLAEEETAALGVDVDEGADDVDANVDAEAEAADSEMRRPSDGVDNHPEGEMVWSGENEEGEEEHDHQGIWQDKKAKIEVWCEGMDPESDATVNKFEMQLPEGISGGTHLEDIDGRGHYAIVPEGYETGDTIVLVMPAPERSGNLHLPNRNCFFAYAPPTMGGLKSKRYYEGDIQTLPDNKGIRFYRDSDNNLTKKCDLPSLVPLKRTKLKMRDPVIAYRHRDSDGLSEGVLVRIHVDEEKNVLLFVDFDHQEKTRKQRDTLYKADMATLFKMHKDKKTDLLAIEPEFVFKLTAFNSAHPFGDDDEDGATSGVENMFAPDTGLLPWHSRSPWRMIYSGICGNKDEDEPEKHISSRRAIMNRDSQSVRYLDPETEKYTYYKFWETVVPFYWFPGINLICPENQRAETSFLDKYGFGVLAYFKLIKSLLVVFGLMSIITMPSVLIYSLADITPAAQAYYLGQTDYMSTLAYSTVASLTEPKRLCQEGIESETVRLECPESYTMSGVVAYYGQPQGNCACPSSMQPSTELGTVGSCRSNSYTDPDTGVVSCLENTDGNTYGCLSSVDRFDNVCCAYTEAEEYNIVTDSYDVVPDLTSLELDPVYECNSVTAQFVATALCEGQNSCEFKVDGNAAITFEAADLLNLQGSSIACPTTTTDSAGTTWCHTTLNNGGDFTDCANDVYPYYNFTTSATSTANRRMIAEAYCQVAEIDVSGLVYTPRDLTFVTAVLGAAAIFVYLVALSIIKSQQTKAVKAMESNTVQASDYTIALHTLPEGAKDRNVKSDPEEIKIAIKKFFEYQLFDEKDGAPIKVADVNLATICDDYLRSCVIRGKACETVDKTLAKIQSAMRRNVWDEEGSGKSQLKELKAALLEFEYSNDHCADLSEIASSSPYCAYVTFEHEDSMAKCLAKYPNVGVFTPLSQAKEDKLDGQTVIIEPAPLPEELIWENLPVKWWNRGIRVLTTTIVVIMLLVLSYAMIYQARYTGDQYSSSVVTIDCALYDVNTNLAVTNYTTNTISHFDVLMDTYPEYYSLDVNTSDWGQRGYSRCFCERVLYDAYLGGDEEPLVTMTSYEFINPSTGEPAYLCDSTESDLSLFFASFATFVVVFVNAGLATVLRSMVNFEKHQTKTGQLLSVCFKLFIAQYINTAWLTQLISGDLDLAGGAAAELSFTFPGYSSLKFGTFTGTIDDYNETWYFSVGASLMFTMFIFSAGQLPPQYMVVLLQKLARLWDRRWSFRKGYTHKDTQDELDALYLGPAFPIEQKYAYLLTLIFVDLTYSATMPLMNVITFINLAVFYISDKITILFFFQKPPVINPALPQLVVNALFAAAFIHLANGLWMFGNEGFTGPDIDTTYTEVTSANGINFISATRSYDETVSYYDRGTAYNSLPYLLVGCLFGAVLFLRFIGTFIFDILGVRTLLRAISNGLEKSCPAYNCVGAYKYELEGNPPYFEAIPLLTLKQRVAEHTLDEQIEHIYCEYIAKEEEDRAVLADNFTADKAATMRYRRSSITFEHKRRESLMRMSLSDESNAVSLDDVDRFHDVDSLVQHNKEEYENYMMGRKSRSSITSGEDEVGNDVENNSGSKKSHHNQADLPLRNCPCVYYPYHDNPEGLHFEGTYLQYNEPDLMEDVVHTKFSFLKHFMDPKKQAEAVPLENVQASNLFLLYKGKKGAIEVDDKVLCYTSKEDMGMVSGICEEIAKDGQTVRVALDFSGDEVNVPRKWVFPKASLKDNRIGKFGDDDDIEYLEEGELFSGHLVKGLPEGRGKLTYSDEAEDEDRAFYDGDFKAGVKHGQGRLEFRNGDVYEGDFIDGEYSGLGAWTASDGETYHGEYLKGNKNGRGRHVSAEGVICIGTWNDGTLEKDSALTYPAGQQPDQIECGECGPRYTAVGAITERDCCGNPKCDFSGKHPHHCPTGLGCFCCCCNRCSKKSSFDPAAAMFGEEAANKLKAALTDENEKGVGEDEAKFLQGHESYNMDTIPEYKQKFGLTHTHMARRDPQDYIMESTNLPHIHDTPEIRKILRRCEPYKVNVPILDDKGEPTGEFKKVVPPHSITLQHFCALCGGAAACNDTVGCECLAEPDDEGNQARWHCPFPTPCDD